MTIEALKKQLAAKTPAALYYLCGDEQYLLDYYYRKFKACCSEILPEFNYIELDGKKIDYELLADACTSYPVMAERKLVAVMDPDSGALKGSGEKKLTEALHDIAPGVTVLFLEHARERGKTGAVEAAVRKLGGEIVRADRPKPEALAAWVKKRVESAGGSVEPQAGAYLVDLTGGSMLRIDRELQKLLAYAKEEEITRAVIDQLVAPEEESSWFAVSDAVCEHDFDKLMQALQLLYRQNVDDAVIAGMFYRTYINLWRGEVALREGKSSAELASVCGISPYAAAQIMRSAAKLQEGEALEGLRRCRELDKKIKTSGINKKDLIYSFAAAILAFQMKDNE